MVLVSFQAETQGGPAFEVAPPSKAHGPARSPREETQGVLLPRTRGGVEGDVFVFKVREVLERNFEKVLGELEKLGYWAALKRRHGGDPTLFVFPAGEIKEDRKWLPWVLLIITIFTTFLAGYSLSLSYIQTLNDYGLPGIRNPYVNALAFSVSVMAILGTHELGHKIAAAYHVSGPPCPTSSPSRTSSERWGGR